MICFIYEQILDNTNGDPSHREGRLNTAIEKFSEARMLQHFFITGKLASPEIVAPCDDDEYIGTWSLFI